MNTLTNDNNSINEPSINGWMINATVAFNAGVITLDELTLMSKGLYEVVERAEELAEGPTLDARMDYTTFDLINGLNDNA